MATTTELAQGAVFEAEEALVLRAGALVPLAADLNSINKGASGVSDCTVCMCRH